MTEQDLVSTLNRQQEIDQLKLVIEDQLKKIIDKDETINKLKDQFNNLNEANEMTKQKCDNFLKLVDNQKIEIDMHKSENANQKNHLSKKVASQEVELNNYKNEINFLKNKLSMY
jgi:predicted RNase H-like nuclease (RuvC/YqgF family)